MDTLSALLALGASGVWMGTRFSASTESLAHPEFKARLVSSGESDNQYLCLFDRGWPNAPHRVLCNSTVDAWNNAGQPKRGMRPNEEQCLGVSPGGSEIFRYDDMPPAIGMRGDWEACALYAGQSTGLVYEIKSAGSIVRDIVHDARQTILCLAGTIGSATQQKYINVPMIGNDQAKAHKGGLMNETAQQYTTRILAHVEGLEPMEIQANTPKRLEALIDGFSGTALRKRPAPETWSVAEIPAHLADAEIAIGWRMRLILGSPGTSIQAFDQDSWLTALHYERRNPHKDLIQFRVLREGNLALLETLTPEQWKQFGMHSERGRESIEHIVRLIAGHDLNHVQQIERILAPMRD